MSPSILPHRRDAGFFCYIVSNMKKVIIILFSLYLSLCGQSQEAANYWESFASLRLKNTDSICFTLTYSRHEHDTVPNIKNTAIIGADRKNLYIISHETRLLHISTDSMCIIEHDYENITYGPRYYNVRNQQNLYGFIKRNQTFNLYSYAPYYSQPGKIDIGKIEDITDTLIGETPYHIVKSVYQEGWNYNKKTKKYDIPLIHYMWTYCNDETHWVDKVQASPTDNLDGIYEILEFKNIDTSRMTHEWKSQFDRFNTKYKKYAVYDYTVMPAPSVAYSGADTTLTDSLLNAPLVNAMGDTIRLADVNGWFVLEFWTYGCRPCVEFMADLKKEKDSLGYTQLEHNGVRIFCINNEGPATPKFIDYAKRLMATEYMYASREMGAMEIRVTPTYYLFSPNRDPVYIGYSKNITETLLSAKRKYEESHHNKSITGKKNKGSIISIDKKEHDYGTLTEGDNGICTFTIKNAGDKPLVIDHISTSCGCTTVEFPQKPIPPGKMGKIIVEYNTSELGSFRKTIVVVSNATNEHKTVLKIKGRVVKK